MQLLEQYKDIVYHAHIFFRYILGSLLYAMILLIWDGQHLVTSVFMMENFWAARTTKILLESG